MLGCSDEERTIRFIQEKYGGLYAVMLDTAFGNLLSPLMPGSIARLRESADSAHKYLLSS